METFCPICNKPKKEKNKFCSFSCCTINTNKNRDYSKNSAGLIKSRKLRLDAELGKLMDLEVTCHKCKEHFLVKERVKNFPKKKKYHCCRGCANAREAVKTEEHKKKVSIAAKKFYSQLPLEEKLRRAQRSVNSRFLYRSKGEAKLLEMLRSSFPEAEFTYGGSMIYKDKAICRDIISKKLKLCIEYDGIWHFKNINNQLSFKKMKDALYEEWILQSEYRLIRVTDNDFARNQSLYEELIDSIENRTEKIIKLFHFELWSESNRKDLVI